VRSDSEIVRSVGSVQDCILEVAASLRWSRPDLTVALAEHERAGGAGGGQDVDSWLMAAGWALHGRAAVGDARAAVADVVDGLRRGPTTEDGRPRLLSRSSALRLRTEIAAAAQVVGELDAARVLLAPVVAGTADAELRADALSVLALCAIEDAPAEVDGLVGGVREAWDELDGVRREVGVAATALLAAVADRRRERPDRAAERAAEGIALLERCRRVARIPTPCGHLAAALATEWVTALLDDGRVDEARRGCVPLVARLAAPVRPSRQVARLRLTVLRAAPGAGPDGVAGALERAASDASSSDAPDLEAVCRAALAGLHEAAGRLDVARAERRAGTEADRRDRERQDHLRAGLAAAGLRAVDDRQAGRAAVAAVRRAVGPLRPPAPPPVPTQPVGESAARLLPEVVAPAPGSGELPAEGRRDASPRRATAEHRSAEPAAGGRRDGSAPRPTADHQRDRQRDGDARPSSTRGSRAVGGPEPDADARPSTAAAPPGDRHADRRPVGDAWRGSDRGTAGDSRREASARPSPSGRERERPTGAGAGSGTGRRGDGLVAASDGQIGGAATRPGVEPWTSVGSGVSEDRWASGDTGSGGRRPGPATEEARPVPPPREAPPPTLQFPALAASHGAAPEPFPDRPGEPASAQRDALFEELQRSLSWTEDPSGGSLIGDVLLRELGARDRWGDPHPGSADRHPAPDRHPHQDRRSGGDRDGDPSPGASGGGPDRARSVGLGSGSTRSRLDDRRRPDDSHQPAGRSGEGRGPTGRRPGDRRAGESDAPRWWDDAAPASGRRDRPDETVPPRDRHRPGGGSRSWERNRPDDSAASHSRDDDGGPPGRRPEEARWSAQHSRNGDGVGDSGPRPASRRGADDAPAPPPEIGRVNGRETDAGLGITEEDGSGERDAWLRRTLAELDRTWGRPSWDGASDRPSWDGASDRPSWDGAPDLAVGGAASGPGRTWSDEVPHVTPGRWPDEDGSVVVLEIVAEGFPMSDDVVAESMRTVAARVTDELPDGSGLRDSGPDSVSVLLPGWPRTAAADWARRVLPVLGHRLDMVRAISVAHLRATVHDAAGPAGAPIVHRLHPLPDADGADAAASAPSSSLQRSAASEGSNGPRDRGTAAPWAGSGERGSRHGDDQDRSWFGSTDGDTGDRVGPGPGRDPDDGPGSGGRGSDDPWGSDDGRRASGTSAGSRHHGVATRHDAIADHPPVLPGGLVVEPGSGGRRHRSRAESRPEPDDRVSSSSSSPSSSSSSPPPSSPPPSSQRAVPTPADGLGLADLLAGALAAYRGL
jgi:hypothetical protein